ncbi:MAG: BTB/POZ protein [Lentinula lateritia]|uniref:Elongin-C n=1 Tax=Lentinula lateritia TaxID=40482 RepID=A0ABQ8V653_9AGAR|nr:MAG: BTB/POZ protein [Lentinula lateritia]KAJ4470719.1 BTB/POZ protein [Lentinula lateritia]
MNEDHPMDGSVEGDPEDWVRIISNDGYTFLLKRKVANMSGTIKNSLDETGGFAEAGTRTYRSQERGIIVQKMIEYMSFKAYYSNVGPKEEIPVNELTERLPPEIVLELLLAADYQEM